MTSTSVKKVASLINDGIAKNIIILTGAGISVASGIPDFRSPGGMYDTLKPELLTASNSEKSAMASDPTTVVSWDLFKENQFPYLEVRRPFILGLANREWKPTLSHYFMSMLHEKKLLRRIYTQNIDGLDYQLDNIPDEKIIPVHGTLGRVECEFCKAEMPFTKFQDKLENSIKDIYNLSNAKAPKNSSSILCDKCMKPGLKPATVLYGRSLPPVFFERIEDDVPVADLCIVIGTSLTVYPAASVPEEVLKSCKRCLINREMVGDFDTSSDRDFFLQGNSDEVILDLITELGWLEDLKGAVLQTSSKEDSNNKPVTLCKQSMEIIQKRITGGRRS